MSINPKSPEVIQAQVAVFASEQTSRLEYGKPKEAVYEHLGELASGEVTDFEYSVYKNKWDSATQQLVPTESIHTMPAASYLDTLRQIGGSKSRAVAERVSYLQAFDQFRPEVAAVLARLPADEGGRIKHETAVGSGLNAVAFPLHHGGKDYIMKLARVDHRGVANADKRLQDLVHGKGIAHVEQLAAISYDQGITITDRIPGKDMSQIIPAELDQISEEHIEQALKTLSEMQAAELTVDTKTGNIMYDPNTGFGFIDYSLDRQIHGGLQPFGEKANSLLWSIAGVNTDEHSRKSIQDYLNEAADYKARTGALGKFKQACLNLRETYELGETLNKTDEFINVESQFIRNVERPGWIEDQLVQQQNRRQTDEFVSSAASDWE